MHLSMVIASVIRSEFNSMSTWQISSSWLFPGACDLPSFRFLASVNSTKCEFYLKEQALHPIREWLVSPITFMSLLHKGPHLATMSLFSLTAFPTG